MERDSDLKLFEEWLEDNPFIYYEYNLYISPIDKIVCFKKINKDDFPYINSHGFYGHEEKGIMKTYVDVKQFLIGIHVITPILDEISRVYEYNKNQWLKEKRLKKLRKISNEK